MCLAIPMNLTERHGETGTVELDGVRTEVALALCPEAKVGDWLIVHAGFALSIMDEADAAETRELLQQVSETER